MPRAAGRRDFRVDIFRDAYSDSQSGYLYGWEVTLGESAESSAFALDEAAFPDWGNPPDDALEGSSRAAKGLRFFPYPADRPGGLVPDSGDQGSYAVDALAFR